MKCSFNKQYLTTDGLGVNEKKHSLFLERINYYKLMSYRYPFLAEKNGDNEKYKKNTTLDNIIDLYNLDIILKSYIFIFINAIEVALRTQFAINCKRISIQDLKATNSKNIHFQYHINKYLLDYNNVPTYVFIESVTLGTLISLIQNNSKIANIQKYFEYKNDKMFISHLYSLNSLRNIISHSEPVLTRYNFMGVKTSLAPIVKSSNILHVGIQEYYDNKNNGFNILASNYIDKNNNHLQDIINNKSVDTFYPYYVLIEYYIHCLQLEDTLKDTVNSFRALIRDYKITVDNNTIVKISDILGLKSSWCV